jgi:putative DNA primase/helicase
MNSIRPRRTTARANEEERATASSAAKTKADPKAVREDPSAPAGAAKPPDASGSPGADSWALPQSVRDRFIQDRRRFYFPDGAPAFRDHGRRLTTGSENTELIHSLVEIAKARGWEEITVQGTQRFRQEAWRQARLAGLSARGYKPSEPERAAIVRARARQANGAQMELGVPEGGEHPNAATVREGAGPSTDPKPSAAPATRDFIVGKLMDHGREAYRFDPHESISYFIEIGTTEGKRTIWGKDLERAMKESLTQPQIGDEIGMRYTGAVPVTVTRRARDASGRIVASREIATRRNHWIVEKREFFKARAAAAEVLLNPDIDQRQGGREHPELVGTYLWLQAAKLAARRFQDSKDRETFVAVIRGALADSVARGDPLKPVRLRDRVARMPERKPPEREPGPARA